MRLAFGSLFEGLVARTQGRCRSAIVAKKKDSVALFEVISKSKQKCRESGMAVPSWMGPADAESDADRSQFETPPVQRVPTPAHAPTEPMLSTDGGRLKMSLNYVSCIVICCGIVLLLVLAFWLGRTTASLSAVGDSAKTLPKQTAKADISERPSTPAQREPGKYYLVIQGLQGLTQEHLSAAWDIQRYLKSNGIVANVMTYSGKPKQYIVWSMDGFDSATSQNANGFVKTIEELGRRYKAQGGKYDFRQRPDDAWFIQQSKS